MLTLVIETLSRRSRSARRRVLLGDGEWFAGAIPGVEARLTEGDGHLTLITRHLDDVHEWLLERL